MLQSKAEVISIKEVEGSTIMGQPDYLDEEANEEQPNFNSQTTTSINKKTLQRY